MPEHPQYAMWKARHEAEQAAARERSARREAWRSSWRETWDHYEVHWHEAQVRRPSPKWWQLRAWARLVLGRIKAPG